MFVFGSKTNAGLNIEEAIAKILFKVRFYPGVSAECKTLLFKISGNVNCS